MLVMRTSFDFDRNPLLSADLDSGGGSFSQLEGTALSFFESYRARAEETVSQLRQPLFQMAMLIEGLHSQTPFSCIVIREPGGRFMGKFMAEVLGLDAQGAPFAINTEPRTDLERTRFNEGVLAIRELGGRTPLIVSEGMVSGQTARRICVPLHEAGASPVYAAAFYETGQYNVITRSLSVPGLTDFAAPVPVLRAPESPGITDRAHDRERHLVHRLVLGNAIRFFAAPPLRSDALEALELPDARREFLVHSTAAEWAEAAVDNPELSLARAHARIFAKQQLSQLVHEYRTPLASS